MNVIPIDSQQAKRANTSDATTTAIFKQWAIANAVDRAGKIEKLRRAMVNIALQRPFTNVLALHATVAALAEAENRLLRAVVDDCCGYFDSVVKGAFKNI